MFFILVLNFNFSDIHIIGIYQVYSREIWEIDCDSIHFSLIDSIFSESLNHWLEYKFSVTEIKQRWKWTKLVG